MKIFFYRALTLFLLQLTLSTANAADKLSLTPLADNPVAPAFSLLDIDGNTHHLADYRGKVVVVNFWATWCPPCREEMPSMQRAWESTLKQEGIPMLAINVGEDEETIFAFTGDYPVDFPLLMDLDSAVINSWPVRGLPTTFIVDKKGHLAYRAIGGRAWDDEKLLAVVKALNK